MASSTFTFMAIFCLISLTNGQGQDFLSSCSPSRPCASEKFLKCLDSQCECTDPESQIYDPIEAECVVLAGRSCSQDSIRAPQCVQGGECNMNNTCTCSKGFYETQFNICSYNIGRSCEATADCDYSSGLVCENKLCKCQNASYIWQLEFGCVSIADIITSVPGDASNVTSNTVAPTIQISSTSLAPAGINQIEDNSLTDLIPSVNETLNSNGTLNTNDTLDGNGTEIIGDRNDFLQGIAPILNLLNPPRERPNFNRPFIPNNNNFAPNNNFDPNNNFGPVQSPSGQNGQRFPQNQQQQQQQQQKQQQQQQQQLPIFDLNQFQGPNNAVPNIYNPPGYGDQDSENSQQPMRFQVVRRFLDPIKRYLFPGLDTENFRMPSPIWLTVSTINQVLPILRAIDYQVSPWLQTVSRLTRPRNTGFQNTNNGINNNLDEQSTNNNNYNNRQAQNQNGYQRNQFQQSARQSRFLNPSPNIFY